MTLPVIPHFQVPFEVVPKGHVAVLEQDTVEEVSQSVTVLLGTRVGERIEVPDYGVMEQAFTVEPRVALAAMHAAIEKWEPRAKVRLNSHPGALDELIREVTVGVNV